MTAAPDHSTDRGARPDSERDLDTDDVTERHTGRHRTASDVGSGVTLDDVAVGLDADHVRGRAGDGERDQLDEHDTRPSRPSEPPAARGT